MNNSLCEAPAFRLVLEEEIYKAMFSVIVLPKMMVQESITMCNDNNMHCEDHYPTLNTLQAATVFGSTL